jgi:hypothetical protein
MLDGLAARRSHSRDPPSAPISSEERPSFLFFRLAAPLDVSDQERPLAVTELVASLRYTDVSYGSPPGPQTISFTLVLLPRDAGVLSLSGVPELGPSALGEISWCTSGDSLDVSARSLLLAHSGDLTSNLRLRLRDSDADGILDSGAGRLDGAQLAAKVWLAAAPGLS